MSESECWCELTVEETVVFEAASAEQGVEGVQALLPLHGSSVRPVDVRRALRWQSAGQLLLSQLLIPETQNRTLKTSWDQNVFCLQELN